MGANDVRRALTAMDADEEVRAKLADGDFSALDSLDLTADEKTLVQDAASDMPEVAGFAADIFLKLGDIKGESQDDKHKESIQLLSASGLSLKVQTAARYGWKV
jgi:hypothetical protein